MRHNDKNQFVQVDSQQKCYTEDRSTIMLGVINNFIRWFLQFANTKIAKFGLNTNLFPLAHLFVLILHRLAKQCIYIFQNIDL